MSQVLFFNMESISLLIASFHSVCRDAAQKSNGSSIVSETKVQKSCSFDKGALFRVGYLRWGGLVVLLTGAGTDLLNHRLLSVFEVS